MTPDKRIELDIYKAWRLLADGPQDWVRLARVAEFTDIAPDDWQRILRAMSTQEGVHLVPDSNRKVLTDEDHEAAVTIGGEAKNLITFESDYQPPKY